MPTGLVLGSGDSRLLLEEMIVETPNVDFTGMAVSGLLGYATRSENPADRKPTIP